MTTISLEHHVLKADIEGSARALNVSLSQVERSQPSESESDPSSAPCWVVKLPAPTEVHARFVREGLLERARKLFTDEVEVGSAVFDDLIYIITASREATAALVHHERVQQALLLLVNDTRYVEIEGDEIRLSDADGVEQSRDAHAELLALAAHLLPVP